MHSWALTHKTSRHWTCPHPPAQTRRRAECLQLVWWAVVDTEAVTTKMRWDSYSSRLLPLRSHNAQSVELKRPRCQAGIQTSIVFVIWCSGGILYIWETWCFKTWTFRQTKQASQMSFRENMLSGFNISNNISKTAASCGPRGLV